MFPEPANQKAEAIMKSQQMTLESHEATPFSEKDLDDDTLVLTLEEPYKWKIVSEYENVKNVFTLMSTLKMTDRFSLHMGSLWWHMERILNC